MDKKGFTLIELLAVIVILAIIAVITVPKVAEMIDSSRKGAAEDSFYGMIKSVELAWAKKLQEDTTLGAITCTINNNSNISCKNSNNESIDFKIETSGALPVIGTINIDNSGEASVLASAPLQINGYECSGNSQKAMCTRIQLAASFLADKVVTSGDGLYADTYESGRYVYKGAAPANYITFNGENNKWRIVSVEKDGTIKIIRVSNIGRKPFDETGNRDSSSNGAGGTYCANSSEGCNVWSATDNFINGDISGTVLKDASLNTYLNGTYYNSLNETSRDLIQEHSFYNGIGTYNISVNNMISSEKTSVWVGNIGLLSQGDYLKASNDSSCIGTSTSGWATSCSNGNYLYDNDWWWLLSPANPDTRLVLIISSDDGRVTYTKASETNVPVKPTLYLKANIQLKGEGTTTKPYYVSNIVE